MRISIRHGITQALSAAPGLEVFDFDIKQFTEDGRMKLEIRFRYDSDLEFRADFGLEEDEGDTSPEPEITIQARPGAMATRDASTVTGLSDLFEAIGGWTARLDDEFAAAVRTRVLAAQQKALGQLGEHLATVPSNPMGAERLIGYRKRLKEVETVVIDLRSMDDDARTREIRDDFESLRMRAALLTERDFLYAVLVRLVKHFWDEERLTVVTEITRATEALFERRSSHAADEIAREAMEEITAE